MTIDWFDLRQRVLDKKIALISHKKVANRVDAFEVLVTGR
jgi:hypothetical protein